MTPPHPPESEATKNTWRDWAREAREAIDWDEASAGISAALLAWEPLQSKKTVLTYLPMAQEVNLAALHDGGLACRWLTTRTPSGGKLLTIHGMDGPLEVHPYGFLQPHRSAPEVHPFDVDLMLIPGLAFDLWGNRLGRGAGYYDRLLSIVGSEVPLVGIVPVELVLDRLPTQVHDVPMTHLATQEGVIETAR